MVQLDERTRGIATQVAAKIAGDFVIQAFRHDEQANLNAMIGDFVSTLDLVDKALLDKMAEDTIQDVFPGSQTADWDGHGTVIQFPTPEHRTVSLGQPAAIPGVVEGPDDAKWRLYFKDPSKWYDNRKDKRNPKAPDFKLKADGDVALWIVGRDTPSWVESRLS